MDGRLQAVVDNQLALLDRFRPYGTALPDPDVRSVLTEVPLAMFNVVGGARFDDPRRRTAQVAGTLMRRGLPFVWMVDSPGSEVGDVLANLGLTGSTTTAMHRPLRDAVGPRLKEATSEELVDLGALAFGLPEVAREEMRRRAPALREDAVHVVIREDGRAVAGGSGIGAGATWGLYNIATLPSHRRRGLGTQVVQALLAAGRQRGYAAAVLDATASGSDLYARAGFEAVGLLEQYVWTGRHAVRTHV